MLHTKYISCGPHGFREEDFLRFSHYKSIGDIYRHGGHLDSWTVTIFTNFQYPFNTRLHMKFEQICPGVSEKKSFKDVNGQTGRQTNGQTGRQTNGWTDGQTDGRMTDGECSQ